MQDAIDTHFALTTRTVRRAESHGRPVAVVVLRRRVEASLDQVWEAITDPEQLAAWFLPVTGDLRAGGRFQIEGNASGTIKRCREPESLILTWEFGGEVTWLDVAITPVAAGKVRIEVAHACPTGEHWDTYGPGAGGVGWDLTLLGLAQHLKGATVTDPKAWAESEEGLAFVTRCAEAWADADVAAGAVEPVAKGAAVRTSGFYRGE